MFDPETPVVALGVLCATVLFAVLPSVVIQAHTGRPTWLSRAHLVEVQRSRRSSLLVEVPIVVILVGGTQFVMAAAVISPISGLATRVIGGIELIAFSAWMAHLVRSTRNDRSSRGD